MGLAIRYEEGQTPLDEEEKEGLRLRTITTQQELNELEQLNIEKAVEWTMKRKFKKDQVLTEEFVKQLHQKMFGEVWRWAGKFRLSEKNLGIRPAFIATELRQLNDNCRFWIDHQTYSEEEIAIRYKHAIVSIHCFSNGNGRHSRLMADVIMSHIFGQSSFGWNRTDLIKKGTGRSRYLSALREADAGTIGPLIDFAKSS